MSINDTNNALPERDASQIGHVALTAFSVKEEGQNPKPEQRERVNELLASPNLRQPLRKIKRGSLEL